MRGLFRSTGCLSPKRPTRKTISDSAPVGHYSSPSCSTPRRCSGLSTTTARGCAMEWIRHTRFPPRPNAPATSLGFPACNCLRPNRPAVPAISGNAIPTGCISPLAQQMLQYVPLPNQPGLTRNYRLVASMWKSELAALAAETGLVITVCHFPPGTSKWNKRVWPGGRPGAMKCSRWPAGRGRRLDSGALRVRNKCGAGPAGPGIVAASTNPRFG